MPSPRDGRSRPWASVELPGGVDPARAVRVRPGATGPPAEVMRGPAGPPPSSAAAGPVPDAMAEDGPAPGAMAAGGPAPGAMAADRTAPGGAAPAAVHRSTSTSPV